MSIAKGARQEGGPLYISKSALGRERTGGWVESGRYQPYLAVMTQEREKARQEFKRMVTWIVGIGVLMAVGAIIYLALSGDLHLHMVIATLGGVFFSVVLGCGLMAAAFFSDKSGHDQSVTEATSHQKDEEV